MVNDNNKFGVEIFGAPGVGKTTFIRKNGWISSHDEYHKMLDDIARNKFKKKYFIPFPAKILRLFRETTKSSIDENAIREFEKQYKEFIDLSIFIIFNSPVSAERRIRCYKFLVNAILSWWLVEDRAGMVWDESFAKVVLYACGMKPDFSWQYFSNVVKVMPKRDKYIFMDGLPEQGVIGQINRGKFANNLTMAERETKINSSNKYRQVAEKLSEELVYCGSEVEKQFSTIDEELHI